MGKMAELEMNIIEMLDDGKDVTTVAHVLNVPLDWVIRVQEDVFGEEDGEEDDGQPSEYTEWQDYMGGDDSYDYSCEV